MSATILDVQWQQPTDTNEVPIGADQNLSVFSLMGIRPRTTHCPACRSIIYSRRHLACGSCGERLPAECRFTEAEARRVNAIVALDRARHRAWIKRFF